MGRPQGSPGRTLSAPPHNCVAQSALSHALGADGTDSSPSLISLVTPLPLTGAHPQPWLLCTVGSRSCGEPGRVLEVTWFSQLTGFLDCMFCRSTFLSL